MTILLLIRHGENDVMLRRLAGRTPGVSLNEKGRRQAQKLADGLTHAPLRAVYSSPLERAVQTAEPLAQSHNLPVQVRQALIEVDYGAWQGRTYKQLGRLMLWKALLERPTQIRFPGGETFPEVQKRVTDELHAIIREWQPATGDGSKPEQDPVIAVVAHADIIRLALAHYLNMALDDYLRLMVSPASISLVQHDGINRPRVLAVNQTVHYTWPELPPKNSKRNKADR